MTESKRTLTKTVGEGTDYESELTITVYEKTDVPDCLKEPVEKALIDRLGYLMDGKEITWFGEENNRKHLTIVSGFPEIPKTPEGVDPTNPAEIVWLPPYRAKEKFTGDDGKNEHLRDIIPEIWDYDHKNKHTLTFFRD